jgi:WD40 repeat protein
MKQGRDRTMDATPVSKRVQVLVALLIGLVVLASCGSKAGPEETAIEWWQAFTESDRGKLSELTCAAKRDSLEMAMNELALWTKAFPSVLSSALGIGELDANVSGEGLKAKTQRSSGDSAKVTISGRLRSTVMGVSSVQDFSYPMQLAREDGQWVVCDDIIEAVVARALVGEEAPLPGMNTSRKTLTVEEAMRATMEAAEAASVQATEVTRIAALPTAIPSPTPLSEEAFARKVQQGLARATVAAAVVQHAVVPQSDPEIEFGRAYRVALSPDGQYAITLLGGSKDTRYAVLRTDDGSIVTRIRVPNLNPYGHDEPAQFSPDSQTVAVIGMGDGSSVGLYRTNDWQPVQELNGDLILQEGVRFTSDGQALIVWSRGQYRNGCLLEFWDMRTGQRVFTQEIPNSEFLVSDDGSRIGVFQTEGGGRKLEVFHVPTGERWSCPASLPYGDWELSSDGKQLGILVGTEKLYTVDLSSPDCELAELTFESFGQNLTIFRFASDRGRTVVYLKAKDGSDGFVGLIGGPQPLVLRHPSLAVTLGGAFDFEFHPSGRLLFILTYSPIANPSGAYGVTLWDLNTGEVLGELVLPFESFSEDANRFQLSSDGRVLAAGADTLHFYHVNDWLAALGLEQ